MDLYIQIEVVKVLCEMGVLVVLVKGGYLDGFSVCDVLVFQWGLEVMECLWIDMLYIYGMGCMFVLVIVLLLVQGYFLFEVVEQVGDYLYEVIKCVLGFGVGYGFVDYMWVVCDQCFCVIQILVRMIVSVSRVVQLMFLLMMKLVIMVVIGVRQLMMVRKFGLAVCVICISIIEVIVVGVRVSQIIESQVIGGIFCICVSFYRLKGRVSRVVVISMLVLDIDGEVFGSMWVMMVLIL